MKAYLKPELHKYAYSMASAQPDGMCVGRINPKYPIRLLKRNLRFTDENFYECEYTSIRCRNSKVYGYILLSHVYIRHANGKRTGKRKKKLKRWKGSKRK